MTKIKSDPNEPEAPAETPCGERYHELLFNLNPIAQPLASRCLTQKLYKCIKKAVKQKQIRRGVKEVQKFINKGEKGIMVLAGDTLPVEVYCHLPVMCEDRNLPYVYIPSK
ncbi:PREDICTED: H/ACA ribonucleoprotein complex subunit 2-like, partial [Elephantulus edwardii]|uniref:H/ACA ribonucleoprotein complex subunit 2-like n=1 Tax=Elephantulus edwardii TaxID=28737 RepID=UPI0003F0A640